MEAAGRLELQPWMSAAETRAVMAALGAEGARVRFVGGCVRDAVLGRRVRDIDIATPDAPEVVTRLLEAAGLRAIPTGIDHGTVTALSAGQHFEITTLRRDVETFGRRARVAFTDDWKADAARRDFTINALYLDPEGTLFDPAGGLDDLREGRVRFVGEAEARIAEDVLRILRFFRFHASYGKGPPDQAALGACRARAPSLATLSAERVCGELLRLLAAPEPAAALKLMADHGVLAPVLPEATRFGRLERLVAIEGATAGPDPLRRLAALLDTDAEGAGALAARLRMSNAQAERLKVLAAPPLEVRAGMTRRAARRALHALGSERFRDLVLLGWAGEVEAAASWRRLLEAAASWRPVAFPVRGTDILGLGVEPGPDVGRLLAAVEAWWVAGDFKADRAELLAQLERRIAKGGTAA